MAGKYVGFDKLKGQLAKSPGVKDPAALAASIGRKGSMGAKRFAKQPRTATRSVGNLSHGDARIKKRPRSSRFPE
jgi:hypothetical protein